MELIFLRSAQVQDLDRIGQLFQEGQRVLAQEQIPQWQDGYPQKSDADRDYQQGQLYVLTTPHKVLGTATLTTTPDPNYQQIFAGQWLPSTGNYATIHRITIDSHYHGQHLGDFFFSNLISQAYQQGQRELRIDTHAQNQRMQHLITKWGFEKRGIVYLDHNPQDQRLAYQLFLQN
ncbi:GNAT family N-acetyltransferase [Lactobacillus sp. DCY120]|uniref:GNAT family N-acetyltransferase n=1 Tax=Bombilactobacillus apium TaxID=2675299 RepID=A0A850R896_9LACO|nr:GNAT family N-acetyltransferase [Bombilactobacillus apium]NVY96765.1 GNAT family N-acetyltransferase [Bombilactobacillus apium]